MSEKLILLNNVDITKLFGLNNHKLDKIKTFFPKIKIISRGEELRIQGSKNDIIFFEDKLSKFILHLEKFNSLSLSQLESIYNNDLDLQSNEKNEIIIYGNNGKIIKARTQNQRKIVKDINSNDILFSIGPAGTGKTYTAIALAIRAYKLKQVKRIVLTRPAIEAGENIGFLPGDLKDKLDPYMQPLYDALFDMLPIKKLNYLLSNEIIQISPLAFMRGRTLDDAFVILDEAQNTSESQMKMFLTRMGVNAKFIITGDITQIDLPKKSKSGLISAEKKLCDIKGISFIYLENKDIIRHKLVKKIINAYKK